MTSLSCHLIGQCLLWFQFQPITWMWLWQSEIIYIRYNSIVYLFDNDHRSDSMIVARVGASFVFAVGDFSFQPVPQVHRFDGLGSEIWDLATLFLIEPLDDLCSELGGNTTRLLPGATSWSSLFLFTMILFPKMENEELSFLRQNSYFFSTKLTCSFW